MEIYKKYPIGAAVPCEQLKVGQEFISTNRWTLPEGMCAWAWGDIKPYIHSIHEGRENPLISCCTDGVRPVIFKLEKIDAE